MRSTWAITRPSIPIARIILPTEHGSWSLLFEPIVVGFGLAYSISAPWVALTTIAAFFARQPLKTAFVARKASDVQHAAIKILIVFALFAILGAIGIAVFSPAWTFFPFLVAAPLAVQQFLLDLSTRGRNMLSEIAGAAAISSSVAAIALAGGFGLPAAMALWAVFVCRFIPSILYVRNHLLLEKGKPFEGVWPNAAHLLSFFVVLGLALLGFASFLTVGVFGLLLVRSVAGLYGGPKGTKAMVIGVWEVIFGFLTVVSIIAGYYAGI
jgi:hypothetical protein